MKKEIAKKWVAALRSGEYKQTRETLACDARTKHCCLGVLCELAIKDGVEMDVAECEYDLNTLHDVPEAATYTLFAGEAGGLPESVASWANVATSNGQIARKLIDANLINANLFGCKDEYVSLATLNDRGVEFGDIADIIEKHWGSF